LKSILSCQNNKKIINTLIPFIASLSSDQMCPMRLKWYPVMKNTTSYLVSVNVPFYFILTVSIYNSQTTVKYFKHIMNNVVQSFKQMTLILYTHKLWAIFFQDDKYLISVGCDPRRNIFETLNHHHFTFSCTVCLFLGFHYLKKKCEWPCSSRTLEMYCAPDVE